MTEDEQTRPPAADPGAAPAAALVTRRAAATARAAVLFLYGGRADSRAPSRPWHLAAVRMRPFVRAVAREVPDDDVLLGEVRYRLRGWNGAEADTLKDVRTALAELTRLAGDVPVVLVGHSMGGRAALRAAATPQVGAVLALAPWCPRGEPVDHLRGKRIVVLHGDRDRVTDPGESLAFVDRAREAGARAEALIMPDGDHAMLRHSGTWHRLTASTVAGMLSSPSPRSA
ncbi:alpha/beta fold hydrolase [Streptomyces sp. NPDC002328]|uniref:alpha/beta fold hydrolase n=1 Tax=Streptomyces sp. NPDC002328 TaxID=3364642 RepID=UPI00368BCB54